MLMRTLVATAAGLLLWAALVCAQEPPKPALSPEVAELRALVFTLQARLADAERRLGEEMARRAALEQDKLRDVVKTLPTDVQKLLGIPVQSEATPSQVKPQIDKKDGRPTAEPPAR